MTRVAPAKVRKEAKLGLMLHKKWKRGGTAVGVARAVQLSSGKAVSDAVIKRMYSYFQRHQHDRLDKDGSDGSIPGRGYIAWLLWGGYSGRKWAEAEYKKIKKTKNPISKSVKKIKEDLAQKTIYLLQVTLDDYRSEPWAQEMVTKEEDFEVVDNYTDDGEPIFRTIEYVLTVLPKKYLQDFEFLRRMQMEGKLEKRSFASAARAWLENDQPIDWFNEQAQDRGYLTKDEYLFLVKVNNPKKKENPHKMSNPARNVANVEDVKKFCEIALEKFRDDLNHYDDFPEMNKWFKSNFFKGIMNSERTSGLFKKITKENIHTLYFDPNLRIRITPPDFVYKALYEGQNILYFEGLTLNGLYYFPVEGRQNQLFSMRHFVDFFNSDDFPNNPSRVSYDRMIELVLEWDEKNKKKEIQKLVKGDEKVFIEYPNGIKWVQLFSRKALENEGVKMGGICIGSASSHVDPIRKGDHQAFSLRDKDNESYVTVEYIVNNVGHGDANTIREVKGYANQAINTKRIEKSGNQKYVKDLFLKLPNHDIKASWDTAGENTDFLPSNLELLLLNDKIIDIHDFIKQKNTEIDQTLDLQDSTWLKSLPENFKVNKSLILTKCINLTSLPKGLKVGESLYADGCYRLTSIPEDIIVGEDLNLAFCTHLTSLPEGLKIGKSLNLEGCRSLTSLPEDLNVNGQLNLAHCGSLISLPKNLKVRLSLSLSNCINLKSLPEDLEVGSSLILDGCILLTSLPESLKVGYNLYLKRCSNLKSLPDGLNVDGSLDVSNCGSLTSLPEGLKVGENLVIRYCDSLKSLPEDLEVGGNMFLQYCKSFTSLPKGLKVGGDLIIAGIFTKLPPDLKVGGEIFGIDNFDKKENPLQLISRGFDERPVSSYDREELKLGLKTELEHTDDALIASKIAKDHLDEDPHYYSKLVEMERGMKSNPVIKKVKELLIKHSNPTTLESLEEQADDLIKSSTLTRYAILLSLNAAGREGLPLKLITHSVMGFLIQEPEKYSGKRLLEIEQTLSVLILRALEEWINKKTDFVFKRTARDSGSLYEYMEKKPGDVYVIDDSGIDFLNKLTEKFEIIFKKASQTKNIEDLKKFLDIRKKSIEEFKKTKYKTIEKSEPSGEEEKKANPVTPEADDYVSIVQEVVDAEGNGTEAWIDESTGDILVGNMAFEEDRSFDDVLIRIKTSGRILEGESVDDSIRKYVQSLMKKIHNELVNYVTLKKSNPTDKSDILNEKELLSNDFYYSLTRIGILFICKNSSEPLDASIIAKSINELLGKKIALSAVYRELHVLMDKKLVIELGKRKSKSDSSAKTRIIAHYNISPKGKIALNESIQKLGNLIKSLSSEKKTNPARQISSDKLSIIKSFYSKVSKKSEPSGEEEKKSNPVPAGVDPEEFDELVKQLKKRKGVDNPYALANFILKKKIQSRKNT